MQISKRKLVLERVVVRAEGAADKWRQVMYRLPPHSVLLCLQEPGISLVGWRLLKVLDFWHLGVWVGGMCEWPRTCLVHTSCIQDSALEQPPFL